MYKNYFSNVDPFSLPSSKGLNLGMVPVENFGTDCAPASRRNASAPRTFSLLLSAHILFTRAVMTRRGMWAHTNEIFHNGSAEAGLALLITTTMAINPGTRGGGGDRSAVRAPI